MPPISIRVLLLLLGALSAPVAATPSQPLSPLLYFPFCNFDKDIIDNNETLAATIRHADVVFTGKVVSEIDSDQIDATIAFFVYVKRFFKGSRDVRDEYELRVLKDIRVGEGTECRQVIRYRYTAIFAAKVLDKSHPDDPDVKLLINPIPVTLHNLRRVNFAVKKDMSYRPRQPILEEPCEKTFCGWGAHCITNSDGKAFCQCPTHCKPINDPVCGTDRRTYSSHCQLKVSACRARQNTRVKHTGACELSDPCQEKPCAFGARCIPSPDGREATCQCPEKCLNYGDHAKSRPVCGSDGVDYADQCELNKAACIAGSNITIKFRGKCDPCAGVECPEPEVCQLDEHRNPVCRCGDSCPLEFTPVCGSDGKTYSNECTLRQEACRARKTLNIIYRGKCSSGVNPCLSVRCILGESCSINKYGIARCECQPLCEPIMRPVCSKDGKTYASKCELKRSACISRINIEIAYVGVCGEMGPCSNHECKYGASCVERVGSPSCECPSCPAEFEPVCGSDGITYGNECKLRLEACKHHREIRVLYDGPCNGCENKKCDFYSTCENDGAVEGRCVCPQSCVDPALMEGAICGTDGVTYANECELHISSCKEKQYVLVAYKGNCDLCQGVECKHGARCEAGECVCPTNCEGSKEEPVCASNMLTFSNECELQKAACKRNDKPALSVLFYGNCSERFSVAGAFTTLSPYAVLTNAANVVAEVEVEAEAATPDGATDPPGVETSVMEREACRDIHCDFEATCELGPDNFPRCTCQFDCASAALLASSKPVCASDLRTYPSLCAMKMEACQRQEELRLRPLDLCQGMELKPCNGERPLVDPKSGKELDCGNGPERKDCPSGSYCHQTTRFARCCQKDQNSLQPKSCEDSWFGCCRDGKTPALGADLAGCPSMCGCNKLGSYSDTCDPETKQCRCRPGVGGEKCNRCLPGYWGLPKISAGHLGCIPCGCSTFGSVREDCEQMTGRCVCKAGIQGHKCTVCTGHNKVLGPNGCVSVDLTTLPPATCKELTCHFEATCVERAGLAICECHVECEEETDVRIVCGSDGQTYASACKLVQVACRLQKDIVVQAFGTCKEDMFPGTDWPVRRYTPLQFTQPDESNSPLSKSTRHLAPDLRYYYERSGSPQRPSVQGVPYSATPDTSNNPEENDLSSAADNHNPFNTRGGNYAAVFRPTPATVRVITALLGDLCTDDSDCLIMYSTCMDDACTCLPSYSESTDRQECIADFTPTEEISACTSSPCGHGSTCIDLPSATFTCICTTNTTGSLCETEIMLKQYEVPSFDGRSFVRLKTLKAYHKLSIEIEFKSYAYDGILVYNQQRADGQGDFVSLAIVDGFVEFRYNLGNGPVIIRSMEQIELKRFHKVVIKRYHRDGVLKLDDGEDIAGQSKGSLRALDLLDDAYVGFVPTDRTRVYENIGTDKGLQGCIRKLKIGRRNVELHENTDDLVLEIDGVHECGENPCSSIPCQNGGVCHPIDSETFRCECTSIFFGNFCENGADPCLSNPCKMGSTCDSLNTGEYFCKCPPGRKGNTCELIDNEIDFTTPEFNGSTFIKFPRLEGAGKSFTLEVFFLSRTLNGLILYNGQSKNGRGDFISLNLVHGYVQFRFNLGSGIANLSSTDTITIDKWHWIRIHRNDREGLLQLDNSTVVRGYSGPPLTVLNLEMPFYIGSWHEVHRLAGVSKGFKGAIQRVIFNGQPLAISGKLSECSFAPINFSGCAFNMGIYDGLPCPLSKSPCLNNGLCIPDLNNYICHCHSNYDGKHCEIAKEGNSSVKFNGATFLQFRNRGHKSYNNMTLEESKYNYIIDDNESDNNEYDDNESDQEDDDALLEGDGNIDILYAYYDEYDADDTNFYDFLGRKGERGNRYEFRLRTFMSDGLLLWRSKSRTIKQDYFAVAIVDGYPEMSYNLGRQQAFWAIRGKTKINDGEWHTLEVRRRKKMGFVSVDGESPTKGVSHNGAISLSTNSKLWLGGSPHLPIGLPSSYYKGFEGCLKYVTVNVKPINLFRNSSLKKIQFCHDNEI